VGISYFNCDTCGVEMNDCACLIRWWYCSSCDTYYCEGCVPGAWVTCKCGHEYCEQCIGAGTGCRCGVFEHQQMPERPALPAVKRPGRKKR
jgi:hypothetical protein